MPETILVASVKNEAPYLLEFVAHYRLLGFDRVLVVTNDNTDDTLAVLEHLGRLPWVDVIPHSVPPGDAPLRNANRLAMAHLTRNAAPDAWIYVADADEFLFLPKDGHIGAYLARFPDARCICFNWKFFGSDGHRARPGGLVMAAYPTRARDGLREHLTLKSMFRLGPPLTGFGSHFPYHDPPDGLEYQFSDGVRFPASQVNQRPHQNWSRVTYDLAAVNHYGIKSLEEYNAKKARGRGAVNSFSAHTRYTDEYFERFDRAEVRDPVDPTWLARVEAEMRAIFAATGMEARFSPSEVGLPVPSASSLAVDAGEWDVLRTAPSKEPAMNATKRDEARAAKRAELRQAKKAVSTDARPAPSGTSTVKLAKRAEKRSEMKGG